jgi:hypothetical protein
MKTIHIIGGGTVSHVRAHLALAMPAYGGTAIKIHELVQEHIKDLQIGSMAFDVKLHLTRMADPRNSRMETNEDVAILVDKLIADPDTRAIVFNAALTDFNGTVGDQIASGKRAERLHSRKTDQTIKLHATEKIINRIRRHRKDIFVVGFKTTTNKAPEDQYSAGLRLLKENSLNLVVANDLTTRRNILIAPEETQYANTTDRDLTLDTMVKMMMSRCTNTFTRSIVVDGAAVRWHDDAVPENLRRVVDHCIRAGAYKPVLGKTAGHFAVKVNDTTFLTSARKTDFNELAKIGLVKVVSTGPDDVMAYGRKPSVGGQSQRIIFSEHEGLDCIVHFHSPPKDGVEVPTALQWPNECGSHECGKNTSGHLQEVDLGDGDKLKVVYLEEHGPNIVFNRTTPSAKVIEFINKNFDLKQKTGGLVHVN